MEFAPRETRPVANVNNPGEPRDAGRDNPELLIGGLH